MIDSVTQTGLYIGPVATYQLHLGRSALEYAPGKEFFSFISV